ncbi:MAG: hypothetical protein ACYC96_01370 [Fimbriimonadaceae bacterium]
MFVFLASQLRAASGLPADFNVPSLAGAHRLNGARFLFNAKSDIFVADKPMPGVTLRMLVGLMPADCPGRFTRAGQTNIELRKQGASVQMAYASPGLEAKNRARALKPPNIRVPDFMRDMTDGAAQVSIYRTANVAEKALVNEAVNMRRIVQEPAPPEIRHGALPSGIPIGDDYFTMRRYYLRGSASGWGIDKIRLGRNIFAADVTDNFKPDIAYSQVCAEAMCRAVQYRILQHPSISEHPEALTTTGSKGIRATLLNGVPMVRLSELRRIGAKVGYTTEPGGLVLGHASFGKRTVTVGPYSLTMTVNGGARRMALESFTFGQDIVVPYRSVTEALGIHG